MPCFVKIKCGWAGPSSDFNALSCQQPLQGRVEPGRPTINRSDAAAAVFASATIAGLICGQPAAGPIRSAGKGALMQAITSAIQSWSHGGLARRHDETKDGG